MKNIVLIGFMGSGKSSIATILANNMQNFVIDTDSMLEAINTITIKEFFAKYGEEAFRQAESKLIHWIAKNVQNAIVSTGGGMPIFNDVRQMGKVVFLNIGFEAILARLDSSQIAKRPLFQDKDKALLLFQYRQAIYTKSADIIVDASLPPNKLAEEILQKVNTSK